MHTTGYMHKVWDNSAKTCICITYRQWKRMENSNNTFRYITTSMEKWSQIAKMHGITKQKAPISEPLNQHLPKGCVNSGLSWKWSQTAWDPYLQSIIQPKLQGCLHTSDFLLAFPFLTFPYSEPRIYSLFFLNGNLVYIRLHVRNPNPGPPNQENANQ